MAQEIAIPEDGFISVTATARLIRAALKAAFPGTRFSVRSSQYAGGASVDISWTDGPAFASVDTIGRRFQGASFDGMTDSMSYHESMLATPDGIRTVRYGADFVQSHRDHSDEFLAEAADLGSMFLRELVDLTRWYDGIPTPHGIFQSGTGRHLVDYIARHIDAKADVR